MRTLMMHQSLRAATFLSGKGNRELVAKEWNMPPRLKELIQNHHTYPKPDDPLRTERLLLILTDMIRQMLGYAPPACYNLLQSRPVNDLGLADREDFLKFLTDLPTRIEEAVNWF